ncbi:MAG: hypothetical protein WBQ68_11955 [Terriglobales bacterium]
MERIIDYLAEAKKSEPVVDYLHEMLKHETVYGATFEDRASAQAYVDAKIPDSRPMVMAARASR